MFPFLNIPLGSNVFLSPLRILCPLSPILFFMNILLILPIPKSNEKFIQKTYHDDEKHSLHTSSLPLSPPTQSQYKTSADPSLLSC